MFRQHRIVFFLLAFTNISFAPRINLGHADELTHGTGFETWTHWERNANTKDFRKPGDIKLRVVRVSREEVIIDADTKLDPKILNQFVDEDGVRFPIHPSNKSRLVPFQKRMEIDAWTVIPTASRSVVNKKLKMSMKLPTNFPHGENGDYELGKDNLSQSVLSSRDRSRHIVKADKDGAGDPNVVILRDVLSIRENKPGGNGIVVRDLSSMKDGHYYLPAFSIPYVGREIAKRNNEDFVEFWKKHDAEAYGRVKALVLTRYALWFKTPNAQNRLIELDGKFKPTGRIFIRDMSDSVFHIEIAKALGFSKRMKNDARIDHVSTIYPETSISYWQMNLGDMKESEVAELREAHEKSYMATLSEETGTTLNPHLMRLASKAIEQLRKNSEERRRIVTRPKRLTPKLEISSSGRIRKQTRDQSKISSKSSKQRRSTRHVR